MTDFLLDTNSASALTTSRPLQVRARFLAAVGAGSSVTISSVALFELYYGAARSQNPAHYRAGIAKLLAGSMAVLPFDGEDAEHAGAIRADLARRGTPIGPYDVLLAGQSRRRGLTLVTSNTREFSRVSNLGLEDWTK